MSDVTQAAFQDQVADSLVSDPVTPMTDAEDELAGVSRGEQFPDEAEMSPEQAEEAFASVAKPGESWQRESEAAQQQAEAQQQEQQPQELSEYQVTAQQFNALPPEQQAVAMNQHMGEMLNYVRQSGLAHPAVSKLCADHFGHCFGVDNLSSQLDATAFTEWAAVWGLNLLNSLQAMSQPAQQQPQQSSGGRSRSAGRQSGSRQSRSGQGRSSRFSSNADIFDDATMARWEQDHGRV